LPVTCCWDALLLLLLLLLRPLLLLLLLLLWLSFCCHYRHTHLQQLQGQVEHSW
jgi:hypothetical protein